LSSRTLAPLGLGLVVALNAAPMRAETLDALYDKAKPEKALVLFAAGPVEPHERFAREFQQRFPGLTVSVTGGFSNVLNDTINRQLRDNAVAVDMAFFQTVQDFIGWKRQDALLDFKPDGFDAIPPRYRDEDGAYVTTHVNTITYAYNTKLVSPADAPQSALDFLKASFRGKLITVYPADDDATLYLFHTIVEKYGWGWMDKYMANKPSFVQGHLAVARSVASGENIATFDASSSVWPFRRQGKLEVVWSPVDETPVFTLTGGIFKDAPHPNAAKLYLTWFLATEQQSHVGSFSSRADVPPPEGFKALTSYKLANAHREFMLDEKLISDLRKRMEGYTGPPVNKGGVR
jgi:ABC-type Fe3+ transport system substrate-binding protein